MIEIASRAGMRSVAYSCKDRGFKRTIALAEKNTYIIRQADDGEIHTPIAIEIRGYKTVAAAYFQDRNLHGGSGLECSITSTQQN